MEVLYTTLCNEAILHTYCMYYLMASVGWFAVKFALKLRFVCKSYGPYFISEVHTKNLVMYLR